MAVIDGNSSVDAVQGPSSNTAPSEATPLSGGDLRALLGEISREKTVFPTPDEYMAKTPDEKLAMNWNVNSKR